MVIEFFNFPGIPSVHCAFCGRDPDSPPGQGDISLRPEANNRQSLESRKDLIQILNRNGCDSWHESRQVHGTEICIEPAPGEPLNANAPLVCADGAMTSLPGLGLVIKTADCQPILFCDESGSHIMAIHCGWRGNRANFPAIAVAAFAKQYKLAPSQIWAVRGPSLGPANAEFINFATEWGTEFDHWHDPDTGRMDLWQLTRDQLAAAGVPKKQIFGLDICTFAHSDSWFSYRRDNASGRQASLIWIKTGHRADNL